MNPDKHSAQKERQAGWNPEGYDAKHSYVWRFGAELMPLLAPKRGERILDLGCGTGHLTEQIASAGSSVLGVDRDAEMVSAARKGHPDLKFEIADARDLRFENEFDAVFSNAALHWIGIGEQERVIKNVWRALRPGGRFVAQFGGKGNVRTICEVLDRALEESGLPANGTPNSWYFPSVSEYAVLLERQGFEVRYMQLFDRYAPLDDGEAGLRHWMSIFVPDLSSGMQADAKERFIRRVEELLRPKLFQNGQWVTDRRQLRFAAWK